MQKVKKYWKGLEQLKVQSDIIDKLEQNEFVEEIPLDKSEDQILQEEIF